MFTKTLALFSILALSLPLAGCNDDDNNTQAMGKMTLAITDAPIDNATSVVVTFTGIEIKPKSGASVRFDFSAPREIDLLALQGGEVEILLDDETVPAGEYNWIRLMVNTDQVESFSYIEFDTGAQFPLFIPSGAQSGLKLNGGFTVPAGGEIALTLDFNLRKSIHQPGNPANYYSMRPTIRLVDNTEVGTISGTVANTLITADCGSPAVYVFAGAGITPDDIDDTIEDIDPVNSAIVTLDAETGQYSYTAAFLLAGDYTLSFTCDAAADNPTTEEDLVFVGTQTATVTADQTTTVNF